jgi:hypothetical protein
MMMMIIIIIIMKFKRIPHICSTDHSQDEQSDKWGKLNISENIMTLEDAGREGGGWGVAMFMRACEALFVTDTAQDLLTAHTTPINLPLPTGSTSVSTQ